MEVDEVGINCLELEVHVSFFRIDISFLQLSVSGERGKHLVLVNCLIKSVLKITPPPKKKKTKKKKKNLLVCS